MEKKFYPCIDCGSENCPCSLALTSDCTVCSRLAGKDYCDCDWQGVCIYNEFMQGGKKTNNVRSDTRAAIAAKKEYEEGITVLVLKTGKGFALKCSKPGSYVFLRNPDDEKYYDIPISIMKTDVEKGEIHLAVKEISAKSKRITTDIVCSNDNKENEFPGEIICRGVYRNGIIGIENITNSLYRGSKRESKIPEKITIVTKGIGFAPAVLLIENLKVQIEKGKCDIALYIDKDKIGDDLIKDYLPEDFLGRVQYVELAKEFAHRAATITETDGKEIDKGSALVVLTSDYYISEIAKHCHIDARSNNFRLCCGEGICGSCGVQDKNGNVFKMCKCKSFIAEL